MKYIMMMFGDQSGLATQTPAWIHEMMQFMHTFNQTSFSRANSSTHRVWSMPARPKPSASTTAPPLPAMVHLPNRKNRWRELDRRRRR